MRVFVFLALFVSTVLEHMDSKYLLNERMDNSDSLSLRYYFLCLFQLVQPDLLVVQPSGSDGSKAFQDPCSFLTLQSTWLAMVSIKFPPTARYSSTLHFSSFL